MKKIIMLIICLIIVSIYYLPSSAFIDLQDGDLVQNPDAAGMDKFDIYIIKMINGKKFKRLILSPHVFESYGHFDKNKNGTPWDDIIKIDQATMDQYKLSDLVRKAGDSRVYRLTALRGSDNGEKTWINIDYEQFIFLGNDPDSIYEINTKDNDAYSSGAEPKDTGPALSSGLGGGTTWISTYCKAFSEELSSQDSTNWTVYDNEFGYYLKYPNDKYKFRKEFASAFKIQEDRFVQDEAIFNTVDYKLPSWWPSDLNNDVCTYQSPVVYIRMYYNLAGKSLAQLAQELEYCRTDANYSIDSIQAIKCSKICQYYFDSKYASWISGEARTWLDQRKQKEGRFIKCTEDVTDQILFTKDNYRYEILITSFADDGSQRQIIDEMLKTFKFGDPLTK